MKEFHNSKSSFKFKVSRSMTQMALIILIFSLFQLTHAGAFQSVAVTADPSLVGQTSAKLQLVITQTATTIPSNGFIKITLPTEVSITTGSLTCSITGDVTLTSLTCSASGQVITLKVSSQIAKSSTIQITVSSGFTTPTSSAETSSFQVISYSTDEITVLDSLTTGITLSVSANSLTSASVSLTTSTVVGATSKAQITMVIKDQIPSGGVIKITFPKWNTGASTSQQLAMIVDTSSIGCTANTNIDSTLKCTYDTSSDTLSVKSGFASAKAAGSTISFTIDSIRNPLSFASVSITIKTMNSAETGTIDTGTATITPTTAATISATTAIASGDDQTVQEYTNIKLEFQNPVPLNSGSIITVQFPSQFAFDSKLSIVYGYALFGTLRSLTYTSDSSSLSIKMTDSIQSYKSSGITGKLIFEQIKNPSYVKTADSFSIYITDSNGYQVAQVTSGVTYTPTAGAVSSLSASLGNAEVNAATTLTMSFSPKHSLSAVTSVIVMTLPSSMTVSCSGITSSGFSSSLTCSKGSSGNTFTFTTPFDQDYSTQSTLTITFNSYQNPSSAQLLTSWSITTYEKVSGVNYEVDTVSSTTALATITTSTFISASISTSTTVTYTSATFTFTLVLANAIPSGGIIKVALPSDISLVSTSLTCKGITNMASSLSCSTSTTNSVTTITISNGFSSSVAASQTISFSINNIRTPSSTKTSNSFSVYSYDSSLYGIDQVTSLLTVTMLTGYSITSMSASSDSNIVGASTQITLSFTMPTPYAATNILYITIPSELTPNSVGFSCTGSDTLSTSLSCSINGQLASVTLALRSTGSAGSKVTIKMKSIQNPVSTKPSSEFSVVLKDKDGYILSQTASGNGAKITAGTPATFSSSSISVLDTRQFALTTITISIKLGLDVPSGGYIQTTFDKIYFVFEDEEDTVCTSNIYQSGTCDFVNSGKINVKDIFQTIQYSGTTVTFTINNCYIDIDKKMTTSSWEVTTMTSDGYKIESVSTGLTLTYPCNSPCETCLTSNPTYCLTCNSLSGSTILYNNKCLSSCPDGMYLDQYNTCQYCDTRCKTCKSDNPQYCTSCSITSPYPFLSGTTCIDSCAYGFYQNKKTAKCEACSSECASCSGSSTNCTACSASSDYKYFYGNTCLTNCPSGYTVPKDSTDNVCQKCDSTCKTCSGTTSTCTACNSPLLLSMYDSTCVSSCPYGLTILDSSKSVCNVCDSKCNSCVNKTTFCTSCGKNLYLLESTGVCSGTCSANNKLVGVNGVCTSCSSSCVTCVGSPTACLSCASGKHLYDYSCVTSCPSGYEVNEDNQCVIYGLRCPFGQKVNAKGTGCELKAQICENGYKLNPNKDRCIPEPGNYVPFPLIYACVFLCLIVLASWIKYKQTLLVTNCIAAISFIETIGILVEVILAYEMGVYSTFGLALVSLLFLFGCNLFFLLVFLKQVKQDPAFKYWSMTYKITQNFVLGFGGIINFKIFRVIYGRFFGKDNFNAAFDDPESFFKPFTLISVFGLITSMLPLFVANIIGLVFIDYGYQIQMNCIEMTIIEIVLLGLQIYEKIKLKKLVLRQNQYYKVEPKLLDNSQSNNVMSGIQDSEITSYYTMKTLIPQAAMTKQGAADFKEYYERRRHLEQLISKVISKEATHPEESTADQIIRLQEEEMLRIQLRNCKSFRELRIMDDDFAEENAGDPELQNFISEPSSPREKEMLHNPKFVGSVMDFKRAVKARDQFDNCYAEGKPAHYFPLRDCKLITVKVQTNTLELLALDDAADYRLRNRLEEISEEEYVEENLHGDYAKGLLDNVIDGFKEVEFKKQRRRLPRNRMKEIPNFDLSDIMGDFDLDETGQNVIIRGRDQKLNDREGRRVNRRGYLVDQDGNVVTNRGTMIFKREEIDSDDEIPAPFCFEKKKQSLFKIENIQAAKQTKKKKIEDKEDDIEAEYRRLREKNASNRSSVDSLIGETPAKYAKKNKRQVPGDEDGFISKIVQPLQAKTKSELLNKATGAIKRNMPIDQVRTQDTMQGQSRSIGQGGVGFDTTLAGGESIPNDFRFYSSKKALGSERGGNNDDINTYDTAGFNNFASYDMTLERIGKINRLKEALGDQKEDRALKKQLEKYEHILKEPIKEAKGKKNLAKKNLARVYGRVQEKISDLTNDLRPPMAQSKMKKIINQSFLEDTQGERSLQREQSRGGQRPNGAAIDSRLKDLESIYKKQQRPQTNMSRQRTMNNTQNNPWDFSENTPKLNYRVMQHSMADTTGIDTSDQDEFKLKNELDKMQAIINKEKKMTKAQSKAPSRGKSTAMGMNKKDILKGGWI